MDDNLIEQFVQARDYLNSNLEEMIVTYMCGIWDPLIKHVIVKELNNIISKQLVNMFPEIPKKELPQFIYRIFTDEGEKSIEVEISIQQYYSRDVGLMFLGNYIEEVSPLPYDLYLAPYYDGVNDFLFYARFGHLSNSFITGSEEAKSEYNLGIISPLSIAYGMAVNDGYIN